MPKNLCNFADKLIIKTNINTMAKRGQNKQNKSQQLTPEAYLRQRARSLEIGPCYASDIFGEAGEGIVIVTRKHSGGKFSMGVYMIDAFCLGIKDSTYNMWIEDYEVRDIIDHFGELKPCTYEEAHNMVYGAMEFALEAGIQPHKSFALTKYMLEEDDEHVPLIDYSFGKDGKHFLVANTRQEANRYLPLLRKNLGEGNFEFSIAEGEEDESEKEEYMSPQSTTMMENLETYETFHILDFAEMLHLDIPQEGTEKQIKKAYIQAIYNHPMQVLERLPLTEITLLASVKELDKGFRQVPLVNSLVSPIFIIVGFAKRAELTDNTPYAIVADDFVEKVLVHLNMQQLLESQQERYEVESLFRVASDLYGAVSEKHLKQLIAEHFDLSQQEASERLDKAREQSTLFDWISVNLQPFTHDEEIVLYQSDYMWDDLQAFLKASAAKRSIKEFRALPKECLQNSEAIYEQLNDQQAGFAQFLKEQFGLDNDAVEDVCFNLWYRAQHEEDPDFEQESFMEYFINEVFERITPSKRSKSALEEAISHLQAYMNAMPRWVLKGHSPAEVDRGAM